MVANSNDDLLISGGKKFISSLFISSIYLTTLVVLSSSLVRSDAKNFKDVLIVTDKKEYDAVIEAIKNGNDTEDLRRNLMIKRKLLKRVILV